MFIALFLFHCFHCFPDSGMEASLHVRLNHIPHSNNTNRYNLSDYRGLKKCITAIRRSQGGLGFHESPSAPVTSLSFNEPTPSSVRNENQNLDDPPGSNTSVIPSADVISRPEKEGTSGFNAHRSPLSRRRPSTRSRRPSVTQQRAPSIKWSKSRSSNHGEFCSQVFCLYQCDTI